MTSGTQSGPILAFATLCAVAILSATLVGWLRGRTSVHGVVRRAWREWQAGRHETALARLERLLPRLVVDREHPEDVWAVAALAEMRACAGDAAEALALAGRLPLRGAQLDEDAQDWLASRAVIYARAGSLPKARADRGRLYSFDPRHPRLAEVDQEIAGTAASPRTVDAFANVSPDDFEELVGRLFTREGCDVQVTESSGDGGVDLVCRRSGDREIVQCKRYIGHSVGVDAVRSLYGVMADFGASRAYLVTTSTFTDGAQAFAIGKPITLVDGEALMARLERAGLA